MCLCFDDNDDYIHIPRRPRRRPHPRLCRKLARVPQPTRKINSPQPRFTSLTSLTIQDAPQSYSQPKAPSTFRASNRSLKYEWNLTQRHLKAKRLPNLLHPSVDGEGTAANSDSSLPLSQRDDDDASCTITEQHHVTLFKALAIRWAIIIIFTGIHTYTIINRTFSSTSFPYLYQTRVDIPFILLLSLLELRNKR